MIDTKILNSNVLENAETYSQKFSNNAPFRFVEIDNFLSEITLKGMRHELASTDSSDEDNAKPKSVIALGPAFKAVDSYIQSDKFAELMSAITGIPDLLYDFQYFSGGVHEHSSEHGTDPYVDFNYHPDTEYHRRVQVVIFLSRDWNDVAGRNLLLHENPWALNNDDITTVVPALNKCVIIEAGEKCWQSYSPPDNANSPIKGLKSFSFHMYTKDRLAADIAPRHKRMSVPRAIPDNFAEGHTLSADDTALLRRLESRTYENIRELHEREKFLNGKISGYRSVINTYQDYYKVPVIGYGKQLGKAHGLTANLGLEKTFEATFRLLRDIRRIGIELLQLDFVGKQIIDVFQDDRKIGTLNMIEGVNEFFWDVELSANSEVKIRLSFNASLSPLDAGISGDETQYSSLLNHIEFSED